MSYLQMALIIVLLIKCVPLQLSLLEHKNVRMSWTMTLHDFPGAFNLKELVNSDGFACAKVRGSTCCFLQVRLFAYEVLVKSIGAFGCRLVHFAPRLWKHDTNGINFTLIVDVFGFKILNMKSINHFIYALKSKYDITINVDRSQHVGVTLKWDY